MTQGGMMHGCGWDLMGVCVGLSYGTQTIQDGVQRDGLEDAYNQKPMGVAAELCATTHSITREQQDAYTIQSFTRATNAWAQGLFQGEVIPVTIEDKRSGKSTVITHDECYTKAQFDKIPKLKPCFQEGGIVTAAGSSPLSDGACALVLMSAGRALELSKSL